MLSEESFIRKISKLNFNESVMLLKKELENSGFKIFSDIDHSSAAEEVGLELFPARVIIFGNPKGVNVELENGKKEEEKIIKGELRNNSELFIEFKAKYLIIKLNDLNY